MGNVITSRFHEKPFDDETLLKLKLFRAYVREWLPVFLSADYSTHVNVFDFFAGAGKDKVGQPGSPLIILDEVKKYYSVLPVNPCVKVNLYFNDKDRRKTARLEKLVEPYREIGQWQIDVRSLDFAEAYGECMPRIRDRRSANLLIIDQFGYKHMRRELFEELVACGRTDTICFMSSSNIRRFVTREAVQRYIGIPPEQILGAESGKAHRLICEFFRECVPDSAEYYVAPFSIKNGSSVHGLMFGSGCLLGLQKFLDVCWGLDEFTGEANFAIDADSIVANPAQSSLFAEDNVPKKQKEFGDSLIAYLRAGPKTNRDIYRFTLESGFLPRQVKPLLASMQQQQRLIVSGLNGSPLRKGSFYVSWEHYNGVPPKASFSLRD